MTAVEAEEVIIPDWLSPEMLEQVKELLFNYDSEWSDTTETAVEICKAMRGHASKT